HAPAGATLSLECAAELCRALSAGAHCQTQGRPADPAGADLSQQRARRLFSSDNKTPDNKTSDNKKGSRGSLFSLALTDVTRQRLLRSAASVHLSGPFPE